MTGEDADPAETDDAGSAMRARIWTIAATFREPGDYGIPEALRFACERRADGSLVFFGPDGCTPDLVAEHTQRVRR
jgi:hypothetical protein